MTLNHTQEITIERADLPLKTETEIRLHYSGTHLECEFDEPPQAIQARISSDAAFRIEVIPGSGPNPSGEPIAIPKPKPRTPISTSRYPEISSPICKRCRTIYYDVHGQIRRAEWGDTELTAEEIEQYLSLSQLHFVPSSHRKQFVPNSICNEYYGSSGEILWAEWEIPAGLTLFPQTERFFSL